MNLLFEWRDTVNFPIVDDKFHNEVWGFVKDSTEYAVLGAREGTYILDITQGSERMVQYIPGSHQHAVHRDYHDLNGYLYCVTQQAPGTMQILDLQYLPDSVHLVHESDSILSEAHNIFIDSTTSTMYACIASVAGAGFGVEAVRSYSLANPVLPTLTHTYTTTYLGTNVHDMYSMRDTIFLCAENLGFSVFGAASSTNPQYLGSYQTVGYNHAGWVDHTRKIFYNVHETNDIPIQAFDYSDLNNINRVSTARCHADSFAMPHNIMYKDDHIYVSYYRDGLYIFNVADPANPVISGFYDTNDKPYADSTEFFGNWGVYCFLPSQRVLASDRKRGLLVFDVQGAVTGINDPDEEELAATLFPNPADNSFKVEFPIDAEVRIYDQLGRHIHSGMTNAQIDVGKLEQGIYLTTIRSRGRIVATNKLVVAR